MTLNADRILIGYYRINPEREPTKIKMELCVVRVTNFFGNEIDTKTVTLVFTKEIYLFVVASRNLTHSRFHALEFLTFLLQIFRDFILLLRSEKNINTRI